MENKCDLPVLYTIPKWNILQLTGRKFNRYFVPELNEWVFSNKLSERLEELGITKQSWYDRWILNITTPLERPKCRTCGREVEFKDMVYGYRTSCNNSCSAQYRENNSEQYSLYHEFKLNGGGFGLMASNPEEYTLQREWLDSGGGFGYMWKNLEHYPEVIKFLESGGAIGHMMRNQEEYLDFYKTSIQNSRGKSGFIFTQKGPTECPYRSSLELRFIEALEKDSDVDSFEYESIQVPYIDEYGTSRTYYPDFKVHYQDGTIKIIEIGQAHEKSSLNNNLKFNYAIDYCQINGMIFEVVLEDGLELYENKIKDLNENI